VRILELTLASRDLAAQSAFWAERLGMPVREGAAGACEVPCAASAVRFKQASQAAPFGSTSELLGQDSNLQPSG
jgi:hypothetical protein